MYSIRITEEGGEAYIPRSLSNIPTKAEAEKRIRSYSAMFPCDTVEIVGPGNSDSK